MRNAKNTDPKIFSKRFMSIYGLQYFKLKTRYFVRVDPCLVFNTKNSYFSMTNTGFPCLILNTDQHGQNTKYFSLKYKCPYIDLNHLEKAADLYFFHFAQCLRLQLDYTLHFFNVKNFRSQTTLLSKKIIQIGD